MRQQRNSGIAGLFKRRIMSVSWCSGYTGRCTNLDIRNQELEFGAELGLQNDLRARTRWARGKLFNVKQQGLNFTLDC